MSWDPDIYKTMPRSARRLYKFGTEILLVYAIGIFVYRKPAPGWLLSTLAYLFSQQRDRFSSCWPSMMRG